jgi:hypothetical protein
LEALVDSLSLKNDTTLILSIVQPGSFKSGFFIIGISEFFRIYPPKEPDMRNFHHPARARMKEIKPWRIHNRIGHIMTQ